MTALITGAGHRIGREIALFLAARGHDVAIHFNGAKAQAEATADAARKLGVRAELLQADLLDFDATQALVPRAIEALGQLDVLVNNASIFEYDNIATATQKSWDRHMGSNLRAPLFLSQAFAQQAPKADRHSDEPVAQANIINMVDQRVLKPTPEFITYSLAKAGLWALTKTLAQALAPDIRVNAIGPGPTVQGTRQSAEHFARQRQATILERGADASDVTGAIGYFLDAKSVTGQLICVDGGQHLGWQTPDIIGLE